MKIPLLFALGLSTAWAPLRANPWDGGWSNYPVTTPTTYITPDGGVKNPPLVTYPAPPVLIVKKITVHHGDPFVERLQQCMASLGYYKSSIDGEFGKGTADAVTQYQLDNGLPITGRPDVQTLNSLKLTPP